MNGLELKEKRLILKFSQIELAKRLGVSRQTIINYENGEVIPDSKKELLNIVLNNNSNQSSHPTAETSSSERLALLEEKVVSLETRIALIEKIILKQ